MSISKTIAVATVLASLMAHAAAQDVTVGSLADAQRKALMAKERELLDKASPPPSQTVAPPPQVQVKLPPPKLNYLYSIFSTHDGQVVAEVTYRGELFQLVDGDSYAGGKVKIINDRQLMITDIPNKSCKKNSKKCEKISKTVALGQEF